MIPQSDFQSVTTTGENPVMNKAKMNDLTTKAQPMEQNISIEKRIFGSGITLLLAIIWMETRDLSKQVSHLEQRLEQHLQAHSNETDKEDDNECIDVNIKLENDQLK